MPSGPSGPRPPPRRLPAARTTPRPRPPSAGHRFASRWQPSAEPGMPKARLGVALLLTGQLGHEVDGLRRALGDGALGRIPPHLTLVPPVNVRDDRMADALAVLR